MRIPSAHRYEKDPRCAEWSFFWIMVQHEHVVPRLMQQEGLDNRVLPLAIGSLPVLGALRLMETLRESPDPRVCEQQHFTWMLDIEQWIFTQQHPERPREQLLSWTDRYLAKRGFEAVGVEELAREKGLSRSNFSHLFRSATGESPGDYLRRKRLDRAMELLRQSRLSIKEIAARTGFADSTHFCKSFRVRYQISPGAFRRMARVM